MVKRPRIFHPRFSRHVRLYTLAKVTNSIRKPDTHVPVNAVELAHADGKIRLRRLHQQMIMIRHQAVGVADPIVATDDRGQSGQKQLAVGIGENIFWRALPGS